jgi:hypothetical protein
MTGWKLTATNDTVPHIGDEVTLMRPRTDPVLHGMQRHYHNGRASAGYAARTSCALLACFGPNAGENVRSSR